MKNKQFVSHLPDLITPDDYGADPRGRRVKLRIRATGDGVEILGDAMRPQELERLLEGVDPAVIQRMLCG